MDHDPVCGKSVDAPAPFAVSYHGDGFVFCSLACKRAFEQSPESYIDPAKRKGPKDLPTPMVDASQGQSNMPAFGP
jgi:YHS domain-containing protein